jgi:hypothetical protein
MATERELEWLDDYLLNRLDVKDKAGFEQKLQLDPALKSEYNLQQRLVKGIKDARVAELKSFLNNTPIPPVNHGTSVVTKLAIGTFVAGAIATGVYFYLDAPDNAQQQESTAPLSQPETTPAPEKETTTLPLDSPERASKEPAKNQVGEQAPPSLKKNEVESAETDESSAKQPVLDVFDPSKESDNSGPADGSLEKGTNNLKKAGTSITVEIERNSKKYNFHYQFKDEKLFLYGPFEKNLYEIMEFFSETDQRTMFLFYKDGYYLLKEENNKINPLSPITDQTLVEKLKTYRGN